MNVSNKQILDDIYLTRKEMNAYNNLRIGYQILSELPENKGAPAKEHGVNFSYYDNLYTKCLEFLNKLYGLAEDRGIEMEEEI